MTVGEGGCHTPIGPALNIDIRDKQKKKNRLYWYIFDFVTTKFFDVSLAPKYRKNIDVYQYFIVDVFFIIVIN